MKKYILEFSQKKRVSNKIFEFSFLANEEIKDFLPGQFLSINLAEGISRPYSIFSLEKNSIKILVEILPNGTASKIFENMKIGEKFSAILPIGSFVLQENDHKKVFFATGTGISPFISMIKKVREKSIEKGISIFFGVQKLEEDISKKLISDFQNIDLTISLSQEEKNFEEKNFRIKSGRITKNFDPKNFDLEDTDFYVCGNPEMVSDVVQILQNANAKNIFFEKY